MSNTEDKNGKKHLRISVSKAKTFHQCKKQFKFNYIDKLPKITRDYHVLGTFCHEVLENFHLSFINGSLKPFNEELTTAWKAAVLNTKEGLTDSIKKEARGFMNEYLSRLNKQKEDGTLENVLSVEKNFAVDLDGKVLINGMIDRIQQDKLPNGEEILHIADYKSTKNKKYLQDDFFQLLTYCYVMLKENPEMEKIRASYILLRHNFEYITKDFSREDVISEVEKSFLSDYDAMVAETEYAASPSFLCNFCDFVSEENGNCAEGQDFVAKMGKPIQRDMKRFGKVDW